MTNPFDPRTVFLAKHAQHVVLIHFPIALFMTGVVFDVAAQWSKRQVLGAVAGYNLVAAAIFTFPVMGSGLLAWQWALEGQRLKGILLMHLVFALVTSVLMWIVGWVHFRSLRKSGDLAVGFRIPLELIGVVLVGITGHLGGFLSGVNSPV
ncbi:MAG: DUF2231 domain-containing protein [Candidatus Acidiferrum sp.]|jgi:uncharacterized membrane protein